MGDIATRADIDALLRVFYARAFDDELLRHIFVEVAHMDLEEHLPTIGNFWEKVLLGTVEYGGNAMRLHRHLHDRAAHTRPFRALAHDLEPDDRLASPGHDRRPGQAGCRPHRAGHAAQPLPGCWTHAALT